MLFSISYLKVFLKSLVDLDGLCLPQGLQRRLRQYAAQPYPSADKGASRSCRHPGKPDQGTERPGKIEHIMRQCPACRRSTAGCQKARQAANQGKLDPLRM